MALIIALSSFNIRFLAAETETPLAEHKLILKNNGSLDIVKGSEKILPALGFALWRKGWTDFTHQSWWRGGEICKLPGVLRVEGVEDYAGASLNYRVEVLIGSSGRAALVKAFLDANLDLEALAWGSWSLSVEEMWEKTWIFYTLVEENEVHFLKKISKTPICSKSYAVAVVLPEEKLALIPLHPVRVGVEDERNWGNPSFSLRFWLEDSYIELLIVEYDSLETLISAARGVLFSKNKELTEEFARKILRGEVDESYALRKPPLGELPNPSWLRAVNSSIVDDRGNYVLLQGVNYMGLEFGWFGQSEEDFARITSWGFNVVRLPIGWAYIEPRPGVINEEYLKVVDWVIYWAKKHGLYVILDMHQWRWSRRYKGCGFPDWLIPDAEDHLEASVKFFKDRELWRRFADIWRVVAERYRDEPAIAAYDIFNEPMPRYDLVPREEFVKLVEEFYKYVFDEIRKVDDKHILMYMPVWGGDLNAVPWISGENIVLTIHFYVGGTWDGKTGYEKTSFKELKRAVEKCVELGLERGIPVWIGEFGVGSSAYRASDWAGDVLSLFEEHALGYAWWTYWRDEDSFGLLYPNGKEKKHILDVLDRPRLLSSSCKPLKAVFKVEDREYTVYLRTGEGGCRALIYLPWRYYKLGFRVTALSNSSYTFDYKFRILNISTSTAKSTVEVKIEHDCGEEQNPFTPVALILSAIFILGITFRILGKSRARRTVMKCARRGTSTSVGKMSEDGLASGAASAVGVT